MCSRMHRGTGTPRGSQTDDSQYTTFWILASPSGVVDKAWRVDEHIVRVCRNAR